MSFNCYGILLLCSQFSLFDLFQGAGHLGMIPSASMSLLGQALNSAPMGSKQDDAIDLDDNN